MTDFAVALSLLLIIEGALYALFPAGMKRMLFLALSTPPSSLRRAGLITAFIGLGFLWLLKS